MPYGNERELFTGSQGVAVKGRTSGAGALPEPRSTRERGWGTRAFSTAAVLSGAVSMKACEALAK